MDLPMANFVWKTARVLKKVPMSWREECSVYLALREDLEEEYAVGHKKTAVAGLEMLLICEDYHCQRVRLTFEETALCLDKDCTWLQEDCNIQSWHCRWFVKTARVHLTPVTGLICLLIRLHLASRLWDCTWFCEDCSCKRVVHLAF